MKKYLLWLFICTAVLWGAKETPGPATGDACAIEALVRAAVEDDSWWEAKNPLELRAMLSRYYAEPLLDEVCERAWPFLSAPTDWYTRTYVTQAVIREIKDGEAKAEVTLKNEDINTGEARQGRGIFFLHKTASGWKIIKADFFWEGEEGP